MGGKVNFSSGSSWNGVLLWKMLGKILLGSELGGVQTSPST